MSDDYVITDVPLLEGTASYVSWINALQRYCNATDPAYWKILTGELRRPTIMIDLMLEEEIRVDAARDNGIAIEDVSQSQVDSFIETNEIDRSGWNLKSAAVIQLILETVSPEIREMVASKYEIDHDSFSDIYLTLRKEYGYLMAKYLLDCFDALLGVKYLPALNPRAYVDKFNRALAEMEDARLKFGKHAMSSRAIYVCFIQGIRAHGGRRKWIRSLRPDMKSETLLQDTIESFLSHEKEEEEGKYKK